MNSKKEIKMKKKVKYDERERAEKEALESTISQLEFYGRDYIRSAMQTISYAMPQLVNEIQGSSSKLCQALHLLEQVAVATEKRAAKLQSQLGNAAKIETVKGDIPEGK
jgi:hypothetical protein